MQQRPFDKDDNATAIDIQKGKQNIVVQLKKAVNLGGSKPITVLQRKLTPSLQGNYTS